jgi:hypothetical protein
VVGQRCAGQVAAKESAELVLGPEDETADGGMQAVSSDYEIEPVGGRRG